MIHFFSEDTDFTPSNPKKLRSWLTGVIKSEHREVGDINYVYCSDAFLLKMNQSYLNHNSYTDIIAFDQSPSPDTISADIYISVDQVRNNADKYQQSFDREHLRVAVHGVLHLLGYKDKSIQDQGEMRKKEEAYLSLYFKSST